MSTTGRPSTSRLAVSLLAALGGSLAACTDVVVDGGEGASPAVSVGLDDDFAAAGAAHGVPADLLEAIGHVETRWQMVSSDGEHDGQAGAHGVMALGGDRLAAAAALAEVDQADARTIAAVNIDAAAALLADAARRAQVAADAPLDAWAPAVAVYSGIDDEEARADYLSAVWSVLIDGAREVAESGEVVAELAARRDVTARVTAGADGVAGPDYASALWRPSPNYSSRPSPRVAMVIIHTCEGNYAGCWGWLRNSSSGVSAHYVVNERGTEVTQLVREASKAWHIAATYQCSRNSNVECSKNGSSSNNFTVGIEHAGFASQSSFPTGQIEASAKLVCDITRDQGIARDRNHIVGHGQLQPNNRVDPGPNWPWSHYLERVRAFCGDGGGTTPPTPGNEVVIVDSNNANNDAAKGRVELTGTWGSSNSIAGYYGSGYWYATAAEVSAPATFWFYQGSAGTRTVDAWWTASSNRATAVPFIAYDAAGREVGRVSKNQTTSGSQWSTLGTWNFTAGWNKIVVSRWTTPGKMVIADAIRVR